MSRVLMERSGEMEVFARVVDKASFSAAARSLDLTPSAVSKLIGRLEQRLGVRLLARTTRALTLTEEGAVYHRAAERILQDLNEADQAVATGSARGRIRVNASVPLGTSFVAPSIGRFLAAHPNLTVDLSFTDEVVNLLEENADVAIRVGNLPDSTLKARKLAQSRRVVCASPDYLKRHGTPLVPVDLAQHNCLTFNFKRSRIGWPFRHKRREVEQPVSGNLQLNNGETMRQIVLSGTGIARLGRWHVADAIQSGALVPLLEEFNPGDLELVHAVYLGGGNVPGRVRAFIDHMIETLGSSDVFEPAR
ncbi:MAG: LysR family transcriptional regulator [Bradyrhizobium sp.]